MAFRLRGARGDFTAATWITPDGQSSPLPDGAATFTSQETAQVAGRDIPVKWRVEIPERGLDVVVSALTPNAWMDTRFEYWEGPVHVSGSHSGRGYLEMTGY